MLILFEKLLSLLTDWTGSFPDSSVGKESTCNVGDQGSTPGLEGSLEKGMATHSRILA